jgi:transposase
MVKTTPATTAILAFDVAKDKLDGYTERGDEGFEDLFDNRTDMVRAKLKELVEQARGAGYSEVLVVCEPSGGYEDTLLESAVDMGLGTAWVSAEAVSKMRVVESNDTGKTDQKDPRVIHMLARMGKTLRHRPLDYPYVQLREWHRMYVTAEDRVAAAKGAIQRQLRVLFREFGFQKDFPFDATGRAMLELYGFNPLRIRATDKIGFAKRLRRRVPRVRKSTIDQLWEQAGRCVEHGMEERLAEVQQRHLEQLYEDFLLNEKRKAEIGGEMDKLYAEARALDPKLPAGQSGVVTTLHLARVVAETGPLSDFQTNAQILRYAGINLRERASGKYRGMTRISKKGRVRLRDTLGHCILPLVTRKGLYGERYHRKRETTQMPGNKAMTVVMRAFLKMIFGWYRSGSAFDQKRVFTCQSQYRLAA